MPFRPLNFREEETTLTGSFALADWPLGPLLLLVCLLLYLLLLLKLRPLLWELDVVDRNVDLRDS